MFSTTKTNYTDVHTSDCRLDSYDRIICCVIIIKERVPSLLSVILVDLLGDAAIFVGYL
jgi:hypothetical protein